MDRQLIYNFEPFEEKKEIIYTENNNRFYSKMKIDRIIYDLNQKGFKNSQIKDIISIIEKYNNQSELPKRYIQINNNNKINIKLEHRLKGYN